MPESFISKSIEVDEFIEKFVNFNASEFNEFMDYIIWLSDEVYWTSRFQYLEIIISFLNESTDIKKFIQEFSALQESNYYTANMVLKNLENEIDFQPRAESRGFTERITSYLEIKLDLFDFKEHPNGIGGGKLETLLKLDLESYFLPATLLYCKKS